jgi:hypothetical protein
MSVFQEIISNILTISLDKAFLLWLIILSIIFFMNYVKARKEQGFPLEKLKSSKEFFRVYLDQYYIKSKVITWFFCFLYMCGTSLIFIILRYAYLGHVTHIDFIMNITNTALLSVLTYIQVIITIILYKALLNRLFIKELNKLYLLLRMGFLERLCRFLLQLKIGQYVLGCLRFVCYRIGTLTYKENLYPLSSKESLEDIPNDAYEIHNKIFINIIYKVQEIARQSLVIKKFFRILAYILRFLHIHIAGFNTQLPYFTIMLIFFIELYNKEFKYIYIASFILILIRTKRNLEYFILNRNLGLDNTISEYFYKNDISYARQRLSFFSTKKIIIIANPLDTASNQKLYLEHHAIVDYILSNFKDIRNNLHHLKRKQGVYRRFFIVCASTCIIGYIIANKSLAYQIEGFTFSNMVLLLPLLLMIYTGYNTYYVTTYNQAWVYSLKHNFLFWIVAGIQGYIFWILLLKPELIFINSEVIFDYLITIRKIYTIDDKILYLYHYFEHSVQKVTIITPEGQMYKLTELEKEFLRYHLRQTRYNERITETTSLREIQDYIYRLYESYSQFKGNMGNAFSFIELLVYEKEKIHYRDAWVFFVLQHMFIVYNVYIQYISASYKALIVPSPFTATLAWVWLIIRGLFGL